VPWLMRFNPPATSYSCQAQLVRYKRLEIEGIGATKVFQTPPASPHKIFAQANMCQGTHALHFNDKRRDHLLALTLVLAKLRHVSYAVEAGIGGNSVRILSFSVL
jgi:hypothetical protein